MTGLQTLPEFNQFVEFFAGSKVLQKITARGTVAMLDVRRLILLMIAEAEFLWIRVYFLNADNIMKTCNSFTQISKQCKDLFQESMSGLFIVP